MFNFFKKIKPMDVSDYKIAPNVTYLGYDYYITNNLESKMRPLYSIEYFKDNIEKIVKESKKILLGGDIYFINNQNKAVPTYTNWYYNLDDKLSREKNSELSILEFYSFIEKIAKNSKIEYLPYYFVDIVLS